MAEIENDEAGRTVFPPRSPQTTKLLALLSLRSETGASCMVFLFHWVSKFSVRWLRLN